jgi:hypothetical protein
MIKRISSFALILIFAASFSFSQKIETVEEIPVISNGEAGKWGKDPKVSLQFVRNIGSIESEDENVLFYMPADIAFDLEGNLYVLDSGNHRIQKFGRDGKFIETIGSKGQGPGEFQFPESLEIDSEGFLYVAEMGNRRIQILNPDGKDHKIIKLRDGSSGITRLFGGENLLMGSGSGLIGFGMGGMERQKELPKVLKVIDKEGKIHEDFGKQYDFKDMLLNRLGNRFSFTIDDEAHTYVAFDHQNRIEKYSPEGNTIWRSERKLAYSMDPPKNKGRLEGGRGYQRVEMPRMNQCSNGIAVDSAGRIWVVGLRRQMKEEERVGMQLMATQTEAGSSINISLEGDTDDTKTDMYQLEIYDNEGVLQGKIMLDHFVDDIRIHKDKIYLLDKMRGMQFYEYKIVEN